jgi:hypothetical protein
MPKPEFRYVKPEITRNLLFESQANIWLPVDVMLKKKVAHNK